jgi:hypothetical protein
MTAFLQIVVGFVLLIAGSAGVCAIFRALSDRKRERELVFLQIQMPKKESKEDKEVQSEQFTVGTDFREVLGVMDHLFQSLSGLYNHRLSRFIHGQPFLSLEYAALAREILFFIVCPRSMAHLLEKQITSFYPDAIIDEVEDYNIFTEKSVTAATVLVPAKPWTSSFKTYQHLKTDPLNNITNAFSKLKLEEGAAIQFVVRPVAQGWQHKVEAEAKKIINPKKHGAKWWNPVTWISALFDMFTGGSGPDMKEDQATGERVSQMAEEYSKALDEKASNPGYSCVMRIVTSAQSHTQADLLLEGIVTAFSQFNSIQGNHFLHPRLLPQQSIISQFVRRSPGRTLMQALRFRKLLLGTAELTSFFHLPNIKYNKVETIKWQNFKVTPAPKDIPDEGLFLGTNVFRGEKRKIFIKNEDRFRHFYIIGQTGTGKSSTLQIMARQDFQEGRGVCIVDPHGSLIEDLLPYIPRSRADDVIYFNPADTERPMGLNLLEGKTPEERDLIALDAMNMMVKMFGEEIFGPRIQDYFRNGCLTLMEDEEEGGAITDLVRLFTDDEWQKYKERCLGK